MRIFLQSLRFVVTALAMIGEHGQITRQQKMPTLDLLTRNKNPVTSLAATIYRFCDEQTIVLGSIIGIGIDLPGVMDRNSGVIASCPLLPLLDGYPLAMELTAPLGVPTFTENDVNLSALGEHCYGRGQGIDNMAVVFVGSGILLNPHLILLGGIVTGWPESIEIARTLAQTHSRIVVRDHLQVERTVLGEQAGLLGAAALVMSKITPSYPPSSKGTNRNVTRDSSLLYQGRDREGL
ncbi:MAG: ROK family protein [Caldilineaceae bacterium]